jgi:soluble lytic murein transglycosylase
MFRSDAVSSAGAIGLTQLGLSTARQTASRQAIDPPSRNDLLEPATNTWLGAATLRERLSLFADQLPVALAAYNAGAAAARRWLPGAPVDADIWIENIPYNETRDYVRRVLWNSIVYRWLTGAREPVDTAFLLGAVFAPAQPE